MSRLNRNRQALRTPDLGSGTGEWSAHVTYDRSCAGEWEGAFELN